MDPLGTLLYGYSEAHAGPIVAALSAALGRKVDLISASGMEERTVEEILGAGGSASFEERDVRVLMFLGFDDEGISLAMDSFPKGGDTPRPIFCGLTEENIRWKFSYLLEHLLEEHRYWTTQKERRERE